MPIGVDKDTNQAIHFFSKAAANGHAGSLNTLGTLYEDGKLVPQNFETAHNFYLAAAAKGIY